MGFRLRESGQGLLVIRVPVLRCVGNIGKLDVAGRWFGAIGAKWKVSGGVLDGLTCVAEDVEDGAHPGTVLPP